MRIAILSDIHGNPLALDAVLADIRARGGVDGYWILGDLTAIGYDPVGVLDRIANLPNAVVIRGNVDRFVVTGDRPAPTFDQVRADPSLLPVLAEVAGSFAWTQGYVEARGWLDWLQVLPLEHCVTLPDGTRVLLVHAAPGTDDGWGLNPSLSDSALESAINGAEADLICVGHFHTAMDRRLNGLRIINPGSVSNQFPPDLRAAYAILHADKSGHRFTFHRTPYDLDAVMARTRKTTNPGAGYILKFMEGKISAQWFEAWDGQSHHPTISD